VLLAGCCYGRPTSVPWAVTFTDPVAAANVGTPLDVPLHPTQLYDAGGELLILAVLLATERRGRTFPGRTFWLYVLLYGVSRFIVEFYRGDERGTLFVLSTSQVVSLVAVPARSPCGAGWGRRGRSSRHPASHEWQSLMDDGPRSRRHTPCGLAERRRSTTRSVRRGPPAGAVALAEFNA
jgi:hypothetical protein